MPIRLRFGWFRALGVGAALFLLAGTESSRIGIHAQSSCGATINPIVCENQKTGDPASAWDITGPGDTSIQGFTTNISAAPGDVVQFKIDTPSSNYRLDIYRMGYYNGMGARKVATVTPSLSPSNQPACLTDGPTGLIDCGNWAVSASWSVPIDAVSGIYFARLNRLDTGGASHVFFIVREAAGAAHKSDLLFQTSDTTWQAYNNYGGNSLYEGGPGTNPGRAFKVSYNRPFVTRGVAGGQDFVFNAEYPMVRFLEANGYDVSYFTGADSDRNGALILNHKIFLSVGHDGSWSGPQRTNVEAARAAGVDLAFFSGNEVFWKTRWENSISAGTASYRTLVSYKETHANAKTDPTPNVWTGTWRDPRFSPPADGGRPENALTGTIFYVNAGTSGIRVPAALGKARFWRSTSVATLAAGTFANMPMGTLGYEWDEERDNGFRPGGLIRLSDTIVAGVDYLQDYGSSYATGTGNHALTLYRHSSGALVFGAGTIQWSWGLDSNHDRGSAAPSVPMKQATVNLFADMGAQPGSLQAGLTAATASSDVTAPTSTITSPANGASFASGAAVTISGSAVEAGGGVLAGVEVSTNGGTTWSRATGTSSWSFSWTASGAGTVSIKSRAFDDSLNMETPSAGVSVTVAASGSCPCSIWSAATVPPAPLDDGDAASVELGMKFRADSNGSITGVRFYKGPANTGTHTGTLWTSTGTQLATLTFGGETASGWQQASFASPVAITANTTYIVSYHSAGHYTGTDPFFTAAVDNPPLHALREGTDGANGVYAYGTSTTFPTNTYNSENYWVDVVFTTTVAPDTTPPTVTSTFPATAATNVDPAASITATFSEGMDPSTILSSTSSGEGGSPPGTFELRDPSSNLVTASVTYNAVSRTAVLAPQSSLALSTTYTALVKGGAVDPRVKDVAGNAMAANRTWTFTTAAAPPPPPSCPCSIWAPTVVPNPIDDGDSASVVLGTKFRSDLPGYITGARFYKGSLNTGTHVATLWSSAGASLATATFAGESASGWQQVLFASPVQIAANTTYVISYLSPNGHYPGQDSYFAAAGVDNPPLHALRNGVDGPNGVYAYSTTNVFPTQTFQSEAYFIDVVFNTTTGPDLTAPAVRSVNPFAGAFGVLTTANVLVTFNEAINQATATPANFFLRTPAGTAVPASVTYSAATNTATITPSASLAYSTQYTGVVKAGVTDVAGNPTTSDYTWTFTTSAPPPPPPTQGPGGPVLVVTTAANPFSVYYAEILRGEGLNAFATADLSAVTATTLSAYDVVILGETALTPAQVTMFTNWVTGGGNLIAMRPDKQLASLLGLTDAGSTLSNAYLLVNTATAPGAGIVNQTMQFHGAADRYTLNGATAIATLYSNATTATVNPAATTRTVGTGHAVAFTYDLARSVVYTRQGNPAWSGQERDGLVPIRSDDLYFGARAGDVQPDWVDLGKVAIPQADEQQRLLWNIVLNTNASKKPLPHFWYFPRMLPAVVIMTGDDHANNGTAARFDDYLAFSTPGCSVADWQCIRGTSYIYPNTPISDSEVESYVLQGFEIALHVTTNCLDWTPTTLTNFYTTQLAQFAVQYPHAGAPKTNRTHCIANSDYATQWQVELSKGIRLDTNYYYFPNTWITDRPGMFTGSGMPQRFTTSTGQMIDVYQAATQMTDESGQTFPKNPDTLLDNAINLGYYGAFTANMHTDANPSNSETWSDAIVNSAKARNVPVITARQMLDWLDGRNASTLQSIAWSSNVLSFNISVATGANGLQALVPSTAGTSPITSVSLNGVVVPHTIQTIKGVQYAVFAAGPGSYQVAYGPDVVPPTISAVSVAPGTTTAAVAWTTNEPAGSTVSYGTSPASLSSSFGNSVLVTAHNLTLPGLTPGTQYFYRVTSADAASNSSTSPPAASAPATFTTNASVVSGTISPSAGGSGATVTLTGGPLPVTVTADGSGNYQFTNVLNGGFTVTPARTGYTFTPPARTITVSGADVTAVNFTAQPVTLTGTVTPAASGSGATVTLTGPTGATATANGSGAFSFSTLPNGSYTVTPTKTGFTFAPASQTVTISGASVSGVDFTATAVPTFNITGTVSPAASGSGTSLALSGGGAAIADASGNYTLAGVTNGSYTVTPTKVGFTFTPSSRAVTVSGGNVTAVDFTAQAVTVSGTITPAASGSGATLTLTGGATTTADATGAFTFSGVANGTFTVTPAKSGFTFTPSNRSVTVTNGASVSGITFTAAAAPISLSIDVVNTVGRSTASTSLQSGTFSTTAANELLLAFVATDNVLAAATTVNTVTGGGLTWTLVRRTNTQRGDAEIWRAFAPTVLAGAQITATLSQSVPAQITVMSFRGVDTTGTSGSGAIGATGSGNALSGAPSASLVTTRNNSYVVGVGADWDQAVARTLGPAQTLVGQFLASNGDTFWVQRTTNTIAVAGTTVTINDTAPTTDRYNLTIVEIVPPL